MKTIRTQILLGMSFRSVAESLVKRKFNNSEIDADWMEEFLGFIFKQNNHSIQFRSKKMNPTLRKPERTYLSAAGWGLHYWKQGDYEYFTRIEFENPHKAAEKDMKRLNRIILDLYNIKNHTPRSQESKSKTQEISQKIKALKSKLKKMKSDIEKLEQRKRELS
jgi:hypothetical protein